MGKIDIKKYNQKDVVYVFGFSSTDKLLSRSPFVSKLLLFLRWKKVPYQHVTLGDPRKAPRNKFPFAVLNGELIADSEEIILRVRQHFSLPPTEGEAEARKKTIGVRRVCEDHLYWVVRFTWITDEGWKKYKASLPKVPAMLAKTIYNAILNGNRDQAHAQGVWRKSEEEVMREGREDKEYLEAMLEAAGGEYFGGNSVGDIDCVVAGMVSVIIDSDVSSKLQDLFRESATLVKYTERVFEAVGACPPFTSSTAEIENDK
mmetsp:Transcript_17539/g.43713  ORF Transcript_17539/g.43713 Transcript_17539/m.43713 type:complete len:260 (-) Transcript_17539:346-1125(-)